MQEIPKEEKNVIIGRKLEKVIDLVGEILAMATIILVVVLLANQKWTFIKGEHLLQTLETVKNFAIVAVLGLKSLEFALKRNIIFAAILIAIIVVAFVFVFIPLF